VPDHDANREMPVLAEEQSTLSIAALRDGRDDAMAELHALMLRAARFELHRRRHLPFAEAEDLAAQAANDAMVALLGKLDTFRGQSRFTTWAYKFALLEAGVKARRRAWQDREVLLDDAAWPAVTARGPSAQQAVEDAELLRAVRDAMRTSLTPHQRIVFTALALDGVPIDVLAERLQSNRGALYKTLHDARKKLRAAIGGDS
jgi:RNA polymerase sigma-70 factor (ECF subfamily)